METVSNSYFTYNNLYYLILFYVLYRLLNFIYKNCIRPRRNLLSRYGENSWAMVTGATDGIGKAFCVELARTGFNIILVSRTLSKLQNVAKELEKVNSKIKTHVVAYDFGERVTLEDYTSVFSPLVDKFDISLLVNNVGTEQHNTFDRVNIKHVFASININVLPQTILTKIFMTKMNNRKSRSGMINLSSFAGEMPFAMKSVYSATKIYNHYLTIGLKEETALDSNIDWLSVKPLEVETVLSTTKADGIVVITTKQCVDSILNDLGYEDETYSHWSHKIQAFLMLNLIPNWLLYSVVRRFWFRFFIKRDEKSE